MLIRLITSVSLILCFVLTHQTQAQDILIKGSVKAPNGAAIPFASVMAGGSNIGVKADSLGVFTLSAGARGSLRISAIGFQDTVIAIDSRTSIDVVLRSSPPRELGEAVISETTNNGTAAERLEATKEEIIASTLETYTRSAMFSNGNYVASRLVPAMRTGPAMITTRIAGFGPLNSLNSGVLMPVIEHKEDTRGSRYLLSKFTPGIIVDKDGKVLTDSLKMLNYDKIDGQLLIGEGNGQYLEVDKEKVIAFAFKSPDTSFVFLNVPILSKINYFQLIAAGPRYSAYKSIRAKFVKANYVSNGLTESGNNYDEYVDKETYFWVAGKDSAGIFERKKKSIKSVFAGQRSRVDNWFSKHKFDEIDDKFLKGLIDYLNEP